jgi:CspA family cold shock protein
MQQGKVKFYDPNKGYGFIFIENSKDEIFLHKSDLEKSGYKDLGVGSIVSYEVKTDKKGKTRAMNIKIIG